MYINKRKKSVKASIKTTNRRAGRTRRAIRASEDEEIVDAEVEEEGVNIAPEASDLLFEVEDVAELVAEVTGEEVSVTAEDDVITFEVGDDAYTVESEGDEEVLESSTRRPLRGKSSIRASRRLGARRRR